jgi:hypothetical protein
MRKLKSTTDTGFEVADSIIEHSLTFHFPELEGQENTGVNSKVYQLRVGIAPKVSNALYQRDKEIIEDERMKTLITLAQTLKGKQLHKAIEALGYRITTEEEK